eukprot:TRINITY_DN37295_c0_g1_i1.p1 TRINITY_DN37295_c0_g1~~TRINITY_DN37295_c0_g1_i1.p1  ORF type:complete len:110 (-),score=6.69 TRINITY_DN37295_c0_g1_i1:196-525(-)
MKEGKQIFEHLIFSRISTGGVGITMGRDLSTWLQNNTVVGSGEIFPKPETTSLLLATLQVKTLHGGVNEKKRRRGERGRKKRNSSCGSCFNFMRTVEKQKPTKIVTYVP